MAMAGVALASCVNEVANDVQSQERVKVTFDAPVVYNNATSRYLTNEIDGTVYPTEEKFMVAAKYETTNFDWDAATNFWDGFLEVTYDEKNDGWRTADDYYWPSSSLAFVAYSPSGAEKLCTSIDYKTTGWDIKGFQVPKEQASEKIDLLYSNLLTNQTGNASQGGYYGVPIVFNHALSSLHFIVKKSETVDVDVYLKSINIYNVAQNGNFDGVSWTPATDVETTSYKPYAKETYGDLPFKEDTYLEFTPNMTHVGAEGVGGTNLLLLPQDLDNVMMEVEYYVNGKYKKTSPIALKDQLGTIGSTTSPVSSWQPGYRYIYFLHYSALAQDLIYFAPVVTDWVDVNLTINLN